ncbi:MAG: TRAP transporter permease [Clostridium sp.]
MNHIPWYDVALMVAGAGPFLYFAANAQKILLTSYSVISKDPFMLALAIVAILVLVELCRRCVGLPILFVVGALLIYTFANVRFGKVVYDLFYTTNGVMNTPINVCQKYIVVFIIFGAFLERTSISAFFIDLANCVAGSSCGGPAKVAVISSALCGMVSGSSVGNTVITGSVTIPMMIRPVINRSLQALLRRQPPPADRSCRRSRAAAFLMAEYTGVPYSRIAVLAILPAILYFAGIYIAVHLEAKKLGLQGLDKDSLPKFSYLVKKLYLLTPLVVLVVLVSNGTRTMQSSAAIAILVTIVVGLFNADNRITPGKIIDALEAGGKGTITVASACTMAGIVAGCITSTGLASKLLRAIVSASGGVMIVALLLTMVCCIVLGMGVPTTATYCIMAATCAPILMSPDIGVEMLAALSSYSTSALWQISHRRWHWLPTQAQPSRRPDR